jgi:OOP family OmpA-OmpF porin
VIGHTDRVGDSDYNDRLSLDRAAVVAAQLRLRLKSLGLDDSNVDVAGRGEREPRPGSETADEVPSAKNRRVEINVR